MLRRWLMIAPTAAVLWLTSHFIGRSPEASAQSCRIFGLEWEANFLGEQVTATVLMNDTTANGLHIGAGITLADAEASLRHAISIWNEDSGANVRLVYGGRTSATSTADRIIATGNDTTPTPDTAIATTNLSAGASYLDKATITVFRRKMNGSFRTFTLSTDTNVAEPWDFVGVLVHELGHSLDLHHPDTECALDVQSVMRAAIEQGMPNRVLRRWDKQALQEPGFYWKKNGLVRTRVLNEGGTPSWGTAAFSPAGAMLRGLSAGANMLWIPIAASWNTGSASDPGKPRKYIVSNATTFQYPTDFAGETWDPVGVAVSDLSTGEAILVRTRETSNTTQLTKSLVYYLSTDYGQTFGATEQCVVEDAFGNCLAPQMRGGASAAYDPRSKTFLVSRATLGGNIVVTTIPTSQSTVPPAETTLNNLTFDGGAAIACRDAANGCRIAYEDRTATHCLRWVEAQVSLTTGQIEPGATRTQCWRMYDTPAIAYAKHLSQFRLLFHQQNGAVFSRQMGDTATSWAGLPDFWNPATFTSSPMIGTKWSCIFGNCSGYTQGFALDWTN